MSKSPVINETFEKGEGVLQLVPNFGSQSMGTAVIGMVHTVPVYDDPLQESVRHAINQVRRC